MIDSVKMAHLSRILSNPHALDILQSLLHENKKYMFFQNMYGRKIWWLLNHLESCEIIKKILEIGNIPIGYELTDYGRWIAHTCINFDRQLSQIPIQEECK